jgi:hypothetical protein
MLGKHHASELHPTESEQNLEKRVMVIRLGEAS